MLVVGAKNSSNSNRLRELAEKIGTKSYLIDTAEDIDVSWLDGIEKVGVTAGASAPAILVKQVIEALKSLGGKEVIEYPGRAENTVFAVPIELR
jgi:4-hydroxy-3-methylbut-2-enyl diphosphate reductase